MQWLAEAIVESIWQGFFLASYRKWGFIAAVATLLVPMVLFLVFVWWMFGAR